MPLTILPHSISIYRPTQPAYGDFRGMPTYNLVALTTGLLDTPSQRTVWEVWGAEISDASVAFVPMGVSVKVDDRIVVTGRGTFRVAGVKVRDVDGPCDHQAVLLERVENA